MDALLNPVVLFFVLGLLAGLLKSDLRIPESLYESLSIYLLLAIGLKGGVELSKSNPGELIAPFSATLLISIAVPLIAFAVALGVFRYSRANSAALATHYGSVSAVTFAVCLTYLTEHYIAYDPFVTAMLVILEIPALVIGILCAKLGTDELKSDLKTILHEVLFGKSIFLLVGGLLIGLIGGTKGMEPLNVVFVTPFKGALAFFLLEMGLVVSKRVSVLKQVGPSLIVFGIALPLLSGFLACVIGSLVGMSLGSLIVLTTLAASASYIAAPAAVRIAIPNANPAIYLTASLAITFPFNVIFGIPIYHGMAQRILTLLGGA